jgi:hypothetical protein
MQNNFAIDFNALTPRTDVNQEIAGSPVLHHLDEIVLKDKNGGIITKHYFDYYSDIAIEAGAALKLWRELYLAIYPGVAYSFDNQKLRLYRGASFEYYFHKNKNHKS